MDVWDLGGVTTGSGTLLLLDRGLLRFWSHDEIPVVRDGDLSAQELVDLANGAFDAVAVGADAKLATERLADAFGWPRSYADVRLDDRYDLPRPKAWPPYLFDVAAGEWAVVEQRFSAIVAAGELDAVLAPIEGGRMPHAQRLERLLAGAPSGTTEVPVVNACCAIAITGLPVDRELAIRARPMPPGPDASRWREVWLDVALGVAVRSEPIGVLTVDEAIVVAADPAVVPAWTDDESADGLADVAFWGRDAEAIAAELDAAALAEGDGVFGWLDLPEDEAFALADSLGSRRSDEVRFAVDFRPHSRHHELLTALRASDAGAATIALDGQRVVGFHTSWGDGLYDVYRDLAADGTLLAVRLDLGTAERVDLTRRVVTDIADEDVGAFAIVTIRALTAGVGFARRVPPASHEESGWELYHGDESEDLLAQADHLVMRRLAELAAHDDGLSAILGAEPPCAFLRRGDGSFEAVEDLPERGA